MAGGRTLSVPTKGTRPTSDRVREAIFSRLDHQGVIEGAAVLDLFAGSGALGLEAASRGARTATLVESSREAAAVCRRNASSLGLDAVRVVAETVQRFVSRPAPESWDVVFADPPYDLPGDVLAEAIAALGSAGGLSSGATLVVERSRRGADPRWPEGVVVEARKDYGETSVHFARWTGPATGG